MQEMNFDAYHDDCTGDEADRWLREHGESRREIDPDSIPDRHQEYDYNDSPEESPRVDVTNCPHKFYCVTDSLRLTRNQFPSDWDYLIFQGRFICKLPYREMARIFRLDASNLCRRFLRAQRRIKLY